MNNKKFTEIIIFIKTFIRTNYNFLKLDYNKEFIGCKYFKDKYYIFYITNKNGETNLTYRENFTKAEFIRTNLKKYNYKTLEQKLKEVMNNTIKINNKLTDPRKELVNMLVTDMDLKKKTKVNNGLLEPIKKTDNKKESVKNLKKKININKNKEQNKKSNAKQNDKKLEIKIVEEKEMFDNDIMNVKEPADSKNQNIFSTDNEIVNFLFKNQDFSESKLSIRTINALEEQGIKNQADLFIQMMENKVNLGKKGKEEISELKRNVFDKCFSPQNNTEILFYFIKNTVGYEEISVINLKNRIKLLDIYDEKQFIENINDLRREERLEFTMNGVKIKPRKLIDVLMDLKESTKNIILERLQGKTLQQIGEENEMTRERIRQIVAKAIVNFPELEEDKYKTIFEEYDFTENEFRKIFDELPETYYYLKEKYNSGKKKTKTALNDAYFSENQKNKIKELFKITNVFNEDIVINRANIISSLIKEYAKERIGVEKFTEIYNSFCSNHKDYKLELLTERNIEGMVARSGIALFGYGRAFRYYNFDDVIGTEECILLKNMFKNFERGYYSTLLIFTNNPDLMNNLKIKDEYELHNLSKKLFGDLNDINFDRMPNFSKNGISKEDFFEQKMKELSPISLNEFVEMMESDYGHKTGTLTSYIISTFYHFIDSNIIKCDLKKLCEKDFTKIKNKLTLPIYSIESLKEILEGEKIPNAGDYINSYNVNRLGYKIRSSYIISESISSIDEYINTLVEENEFIPKTNFLNNSTYGAAMKKAEKNFDIAHISKDEYITIKKLRQLGVCKTDFSDFCRNVSECFKNEKFFTLDNVRDTIDIGKIDDLGFDDIFLENIISVIEGIANIKLSNKKIFSFVNERIDNKIFISENVGSRNSVFLSDLQEEIEEKYGINISEDKIKNIIIETDLYYSENLNKIFQSKEHYYEEVYSYEQ